MDKAEKEKRKLLKKKEKEKAKRYRKLGSGLDICLILLCFFTCLLSAILQRKERNAGNPA